VQISGANLVGYLSQFYARRGWVSKVRSNHEPRPANVAALCTHQQEEVRKRKVKGIRFERLAEQYLLGAVDGAEGTTDT
jgi:hypothetical protein